MPQRLDARGSHGGALLTKVDRATADRCGTGGAYGCAVLAQVDRTAANSLGTLGSGYGTTLSRCLDVLDRNAANLANAITPLLAAHEDRGANVFTPLKAIIALSPAEHTASHAINCGWRQRDRQSESKVSSEPVRENGTQPAFPRDVRA